MTLMYDSDIASDIPDSAEMVAGYVNGYAAPSWASPAGFARFAGRSISIDVNGTRPDADALDIEVGDATPDMAANWINQHYTHTDRIAIIYCSQSVIAQIRELCAGLRYLIWSAHYTGQPHICTGADATQYADPNAGSGGHYDLSLLSDTFLGGTMTQPTTTTANDTESGLINALAYVCDSLGDQLKAATATIADLEAEMARVREQFIGPREAAA